MASPIQFNRAQKRAQIIRDELKYLEPHHLDTFIDGISDDEPPTYRFIENKIHPPLSQVGLKDSATKYDLGNVRFPHERDAVYWAQLIVDNARFDLRVSEALPNDESNILTHPIQAFVANDMLPLFEAKFEAIHQRRSKINEARQFAYSMLNQPKPRFSEGESLARLRVEEEDPQTEQHSGAVVPAKRGAGSITRHPANKRKRIGLAAIPDSVKANTFAEIPNQFKVELFNSMIKAAFPNYDDVLMASWNVISVYQNLGTEYPELHKAICALRIVLHDFEAAHGERKLKQEPVEDVVHLPREPSHPHDDVEPSPASSVSEEVHEPSTVSLAANHTTPPSSARGHDELAVTVPSIEVEQRDRDRAAPSTTANVPAHIRRGQATLEQEKFRQTNQEKIKEFYKIKPRWTPERERDPSGKTKDELRKERKEEERRERAKKIEERNALAARREHSPVQRGLDLVPEYPLSGNGGAPLPPTPTQRFVRESPHDHAADSVDELFEESGPRGPARHQERRYVEDVRFEDQQQQQQQQQQPRGLAALVRSQESRFDTDAHAHAHASSPYKDARKQPDAERQSPATSSSRNNGSVYLGSSKLGAPKKMAYGDGGNGNGNGSAPVAPMMHSKKDGNGNAGMNAGNGNGDRNGDRRRP
ncbi:hypothetical protein BDV95DRAFT_643248 [Massariosphaeria phaeospora]|uniref:Uncharacterized protein n=1 Tax=Massariosphaeria phaeospora TaxID=100035 RepID=A0A7C8IAK3_9PLEO|nr:hypothetical protein BDV95DRAFT_643248 [Massariosphaeria phaeospora]